MTARTGFVPPAYPYDRLGELQQIAAAHPGGAIDCSIGDPFDPPPASVTAALGRAPRTESYPPSIGTPELRSAACGWMSRELGVTVDPDDEVAACIGTKEMVASLPHLLALRRPDLDTVLYPAVSYPSYAMGATLAGCRAVPVPVDDAFRIDLGRVDPADAARALCLWVNSPGNPAGGLDDLAAAAAWGRERGIPVVSDECYVEFTWTGPRRTILSEGLDGLLAVHSLSKRSNMAGFRVGFYAGDPELVHYLREVRKHAGAMVPAPIQAAAVEAWKDQSHVDEQRRRYRRRLELLVDLCEAAGVEVAMPDGAFYLWVAAPDGDAWALAADLAKRAGLVASPGEFYGEAGAGHLRIAAVHPEEALLMARQRLG